MKPFHSRSEKPIRFLPLKTTDTSKEDRLIILAKIFFNYICTLLTTIKMKSLKTAIKLMLILLMGIPTISIAQSLTVISGNFDFLKDQKELNIEFDYSPLTFYNEKISEDEYVKRRIKEISDSKGKTEGEIWKSDWEQSKTNDFQNKFISLMNRNLKIIETNKNPNAKYTLIVQSVWIYPGWFAGVMAQAAKVSTRLKFVETENPSYVLLEIDSEKAPGSAYGGVANNNDRMAEGYAKTGKSLAKLITKKIK